MQRPMTASHPQRRIKIAARVLLFWAAAATARADVIEITPEGLVTTYSAPMVYTEDGASRVQKDGTPAPARGSRTSAPQNLTSALARAASASGLSYDILEAVAWQESRHRQQAVSVKGAVGVMQLMPATARQLRVDPHDLEQNIFGGAVYLSQMLQRYRGDLTLALAAYNAGPGAVDRYGGVPPYAETRAYVAAILSRLASRTR